MLENILDKKNNETIIFTGDIAFSGYFTDSYKNPNFISSEILDFLNSSTHVIANIESPITNSQIISNRPLNHVMSPNVINYLNKININIWNLGNNHIMDCQNKGLKDTLQYAKENNIITIGAGITKKEASKPIIIGDKIKIGLISLTKEWKQLNSDDKNPGCVFYTDNTTIEKQIKELKKHKVDYIVAIIHCGEEFASLPMIFDRKRYIELLDLGVDIIVGHHPHVIQNFEKIGDKTIFYSLGNFIFDTEFQRLQTHTEYGILLKINFEKNNYSFDYITIKNDRDNSRIIKTSNNPIFININNKNYKKYYPLSVRQYIKNDKKAQEYKDKKNNKNNSFLKKLKKKLRIIKSRKKLRIFIDNYKSYFIKYNNNQVLVKYIKERE